MSQPTDGNVLPARVRSKYPAPGDAVRGALVTVHDDGQDIPVRWRLGRYETWRCDVCGPQPRPTCPHTFAAALRLAEELFGLTRAPELQPFTNGAPTP